MDVYTIYARSKLINFCMWAVVFTKRMMTLVTEKAFLVDVGAFDVFKRVFVFQKFVYPFFQLVGKVLTVFAMNRFISALVKIGMFFKRIPQPF